MEKYLYFRTEATDANDDATGDSACFAASSLMGMQPTGDTELTLYFRSMVNFHFLANTNDTVALTINANTHLKTISAIIEAINGEDTPSLIIVANDDSGGTEYLAGSSITACATITVEAAYGG